MSCKFTGMLIVTEGAAGAGSGVCNVGLAADLAANATGFAAGATDFTIDAAGLTICTVGFTIGLATCAAGFGCWFWLLGYKLIYLSVSKIPIKYTQPKYFYFLYVSLFSPF